MDAAVNLRSNAIESRRLRAGAELVVVLLLLEGELWNLRSWAPPWLHALVYALLVGTMLASLARRRSEAASGSLITPHRHPLVSAPRAWTEAVAACLVLALILVGAAGLLGDHNETFEFVFLQKPPGKLAVWLVGKFLAALGQQLALMWFLWPLGFEVTRSRPGGAVLAATIFALVHLPSPTLVAITLVAGLVWITLFQRSDRLAPLVAVHMALATLAHGSLPERLTYDMRVGMTAVADTDRFTALEDPRVRQINRRLKEHRDDLRHFTSAAYYQAQGGTDAGFVGGLFRDILGRPATAADLAFWEAQQYPDRRVQIPSIFLASDELAQILDARRAQGKPTTLAR